MANAHTLRPPGLDADSVTAIVGLVSDTHFPQRCRQLPPALFAVLDGVDLLLHGGDVGVLSVLDDLSRLAPVVAVHGNDDTEEAQRELPYRQIVTIAGTRIFLWHSHYQDPVEEHASRIGDDMVGKFDRTVVAARQAGASIAVFGHWHIPLVYARDGITVVNPGAIASGNEFTRQLVQTVALLFLTRDGGHYIVHVDLANPDRSFVSPVDVYAGFDAAASYFSASIVTPELRAMVPKLRAGLTAEEFHDLRAIVAEVAHRCWSGELPLLDVDLVRVQFEQREALSPALRQKLAAIFDPLPRA